MAADGPRTTPDEFILGISLMQNQLDAVIADKPKTFERDILKRFGLIDLPQMSAINNDEFDKLLAICKEFSFILKNSKSFFTFVSEQILDDLKSYADSCLTNEEATFIASYTLEAASPNLLEKSYFSTALHARNWELEVQKKCSIIKQLNFDLLAEQFQSIPELDLKIHIITSQNKFLSQNTCFDDDFECDFIDLRFSKVAESNDWEWRSSDGEDYAVEYENLGDIAGADLSPSTRRQFTS
jgi:hypothetical protein